MYYFSLITLVCPWVSPREFCYILNLIFGILLTVRSIFEYHLPLGEFDYLRSVLPDSFYQGSQCAPIPLPVISFCRLVGSVSIILILLACSTGIRILQKRWWWCGECSACACHGYKDVGKYWIEILIGNSISFNLGIKNLISLLVSNQIEKHPLQIIIWRSNTYER